jgi:predicted transcriptional regulator
VKRARETAIFLHEPLTVGELAERLELKMTTASLVATELEPAGMVARERAALIEAFELFADEIERGAS